MKRYTLKRLYHYCFLIWARLPIIPGHKRHYLLRLAGLHLPPPPDCQLFIGKSVLFDTFAPQNIHIGNHTFITEGAKILTHYYNPVTRKFSIGNVFIGNQVFIGMNVIICKPVSIGDGAVIGAGSVITKDIPPYELWAGVPARFVKKLQ